MRQHTDGQTDGTHSPTASLRHRIKKPTQNRVDGAGNEEEGESGGAPIPVTQFEPVNAESQIRVNVQRVTHQPEHVGQDHANGEYTHFVSFV